MPDRAPPLRGPATTTEAMVELYGQILPLLTALRDVARPLAARRPANLVPESIHCEARMLLGIARRVLSREKCAGLLDPLERPGWASLLSKLELALAGLEGYHTRYRYYDAKYATYFWRDQAWLSLMHLDAKSINKRKALGKKSP